MKLVKVLICVALSLSFLIIGIGFAVPNATLNFTGDVSFQHTGLYISSIETTGNVNISGYSGTLLNLTADAGSTMTITVTNPLSESWYYLNYVAGEYTFTSIDIAIGKEVKGNGGTVTFTVTFPAITTQQVVQFTFVDTPSSAPGDSESGTTNATKALEFVLNDETRGLNNIGKGKHHFENWCNSGYRILYCRDNNITGGNLKNLFDSESAGNVLFTMEWVSEGKYNLYLYYSFDVNSDDSEGNPVVESGKHYVVVYKEEIVFNDSQNKWVVVDSHKGYSKVATAKGGNGIETGTNTNGDPCVIWHETLPEGAILAAGNPPS